MKHIFKRTIFLYLSAFTALCLNAADIVWDFTDLSAESFTNGRSYAYTATDGITEMRYSAGSSDKIEAKSGSTDGYLRENGTTGSGTVYDIDGQTNIKKNRLIRLFVTGKGKLTITCNSSNIGQYKLCNGSESGAVLISSYTANTTSEEIEVTTSLLWIETTKKGYINTITWTPTESTTPTPTEPVDPAPGEDGDMLYQFTVTSSTTAAGTYDAIGGTAKCTRAMSSESVTVDGQTFYKFESSTSWQCTLSNGSFKEGDIVTILVSASSNKNNDGVILNNNINLQETILQANKITTLTYIVQTGDDIDEQSTIEIKRINSGVKFGTITVTRPQTGPSKVATLKSLTYNGTSVPNFSADKTDYEVELPAGTTQLPTVAATATDNNASVSITQATALPGMATIEVTAEDGTTTKTYTVTFTVASSAPKVLTATWSNIRGTATIDQVNRTITGEVTNGSTLTLTPTFTGDNISSWTPTTAQNFANSTPITYTFTSATNETTTYTVTITEAPPMSSDATLSNLTVAGYTINFSPTTYSYTVELKSGTTTAPAVSYTLNDSKATATETKATSIPGVHQIVVTAEDGSTLTYTINFTVALPSTDLTCHEPEVYEAATIDGGYGTPLVQYNGREYEVYYISRGNPNDKSVIRTQYITDKQDNSFIVSTNETKTTVESIDGWFIGNTSEQSTTSSTTAYSQFKSGFSGIWKMNEDNSFELHIKGFDQFSILAKDKKNGTKESDLRHFLIYIDGVLQESQINTDVSVRDYNITTGEHIIKIAVKHSEKSELYAFSLRVSYSPRLKHITGNDSTQSVLQTDNIKPITYYLKNRIADAELSWVGAEATGISLQKGTNDTLYLQGTANCPNGEYRYTISAKDENGAVVSTISGKFNVTSKIIFQRQTDDTRTVYEKSSISPIVFRYYSIEPNDVSWKWTSATPAGLSFTNDPTTHTVSLAGTPTTIGTFTYEVSLKDANTVSGTIIVESSSPTIVPGASSTMLYLYKANKIDGIYTELIKSYNYFARPAGGNSSEDDYKEYDFIVISEDVDANNEEVLNIIKNIKKPVLNLKSQTYSTSRLGWGYPDNGSVNNTKITVLQPKHAIFNGMNATKGGTIDILSMVSGRGLMPVRVTKPSTYALATALTQGEEYTEDGEAETFLHEVSRAERGAKYILMPVSTQSAGNLTTQGKTLLRNVINYLLSTEESVIEVPELKITRFAINGMEATIDHNSLEITMELPYGTDLTALTPEIQTASADTYVTPASGETIDFSDSYFGVRFTVSDYINRLVYTARVTTATGLENTELQGVRMEGNVLRNPNGIGLSIYNIQGVLVGMTNSDFSFSGLPKSLYLIVGEKETMKILLR